MKKIIAALSACVIAPICAGSTVHAESDDASADKFVYRISGEDAYIYYYEGTDAVLSIPSEINGHAVAGIDENVFMGLEGLTEVIIPDSVKTIGSRAFSACPNLKTVTIGNSVSEIGSFAFSACPELQEIKVDDKNESFSSPNGSLTDESGTTLLLYAGANEAVIPDSVTSIGTGAFLGKTGLTSAIIPDKAEYIGDYAFSGCTALKSISIPDSVSYTGANCFMSCSELESVTLSQNTKAIPDNIFRSCSSLDDILIPRSVTSIGTDAFLGCTELSGIYIPENTTGIDNCGIGKYYNIRSGEIENIENFTVYGKIGSSAQDYCETNDIDFQSFMLGDVNKDGVLDGTDATLTLQEYTIVLSGMEANFKAYEKAAADYNFDGIVDGTDATLILTEYTRIISQIPE